jgi:uncharacterized SAM-binding protein YcdF (DUF218 family)
MSSSGSGGDRHDPLWAVTKPTRPRPSPAAASVEVADVVDSDLAATAALPATPHSASPHSATAPRPSEPAPDDLDRHLEALGVSVEGMPSVSPAPGTPVELPHGGPVDPDGPDELPTARTTLPVESQEPTVADLPLIGEDDATISLHATGFASDPLASSAVPEPRFDVRAEMIAMIPDSGNTSILTSPLLDPTPPSGQRMRFRRRRSWRRRVLGLVGVLAVAAVGYYTISLFQVWSTGVTDHRETADVIAVLGAAQYDGRPSPQLRARLDHAVELYEEGVAPVVFVTGGKQEGDRFTEAETSRDHLVRAGVPAIAILMENEGSSTWESLQNMSGALDELDLDDVIIVTDPYHSLRAKLMAEELGMTAHVSPTRTSPVQGGAAFWRHVREAGGVAVGRIVGFSRLDRLLG